jgi:hypothetical protein
MGNILTILLEFQKKENKKSPNNKLSGLFVFLTLEKKMSKTRLVKFLIVRSLL